MTIPLFGIKIDTEIFSTVKDNWRASELSTYRKEGMLTLNSHELPRQNFSLLHLYDIMQTSDENTEKYQLWDY